jgi:hypothetical protein
LLALWLLANSLLPSLLALSDSNCPLLSFATIAVIEVAIVSASSCLHLPASISSFHQSIQTPSLKCLLIIHIVSTANSTW